MPQKITPRIDERWIRHDWRLWIRHDIARWMKPGVDPADVIPALARERAQKQAAEERARAAEDAALAAEIEHERRAWAALNEEVKEVNAEMARWRRRLAEEEAKYSPSQPRVPAGNPRGGQWTDRGGGQGTVANPGQDRDQGTEASLAQPMGNVGIGDVSGSNELDGLFRIKPDEPRKEGVRLAANDTPEDPTPVRDPTPIREAAPLVDPAPKIPEEMPPKGGARMVFVRDAAQWVARNAGRAALAVETYFEALDQVEKIKALTDAIKSANDPAKTLEELQAPIGSPSQGGYEDHHIVGQHPQNRQQFGDDLIDSRENKVRIPVVEHIDISAWYSRGNDEFDGLSPRDYLRGKDWDEQRRVGLDILRKRGVLK